MIRSINDIFSDIVQRASDRYGSNISYIFGDWAYISNQMALWGKSDKTCRFKFPIICLYSPFVEERTGKGINASLDFIIMVNTMQAYTNEDREKASFENVLRPIYRIFLEETNSFPDVVSNYSGIIPHSYSENYRYGRVGVIGDDGKPFSDFIDAIEIKNLNITIKNKKCYGNRL